MKSCGILSCLCHSFMCMEEETQNLCRLLGRHGCKKSGKKPPPCRKSSCEKTERCDFKEEKCELCAKECDFFTQGY